MKDFTTVCCYSENINSDIIRGLGEPAFPNLCFFLNSNPDILFCFYFSLPDIELLPMWVTMVTVHLA